MQIIFLHSGDSVLVRLLMNQNSIQLYSVKLTTHVGIDPTTITLPDYSAADKFCIFFICMILQ